MLYNNAAIGGLKHHYNDDGVVFEGRILKLNHHKVHAKDKVACLVFISLSVISRGRRIPTPMPPPKEEVQYPNRSNLRLVGSDASYKLSPYEMEALNAVKASAPKMDRNGYFFYVASTAKKKKISLMQPRPPRVAFVDEKKRPGTAERVQSFVSIAPNSAESTRVGSMTQRGPSPAPRARLYSQLESYQPRYHTIRDNGDSKRVESECRRRKKDQKPTTGYQQVLR
ncbi:hypothetical protein evm_005709 [Chilo suppressalis]|nr:hypothetical protein evm_005709 [Chilo suppressalis]